MERLTAKATLNPFGEVTIEAVDGDPNWRLHLYIFASGDLRYNPGHAALTKNDALYVIDALWDAWEGVEDPSNFNPVAMRERTFGTFGGLTVTGRYYPQGHFTVQFSARSSTMTHSRVVGNVETVINQLSAIIEMGDRMVA